MEMRESALDYASRGWAVFAVHSIQNGCCTCGNRFCKAPGKHPVYPGGYTIATKDSAQIAEIWHFGSNFNIGIATGSVSGIFVLDVDVGKKNGVETLARLEANNPLLKRSLVAKTGSGGLHLYFEMPDRPMRSSAGKLGEGLDIRADGGHVVAPPSLHISGNRYIWENKNE